jgi:dihydrolipoamide dehydrogenase
MRKFKMVNDAGKKTNVLVIGGGPGGTPLAEALAVAGLKVLLVEKGSGLGGTCLFEGCIPSKILWETARRLRELKAARNFGIDLPPGEVRLDWARLIARKTQILRQRSSGAMANALTFPTLKVERGQANFIQSNVAQIIPSNGPSYKVHFEKAVIATGSIPNLLPIPGVHSSGVLTSEQLLNIDHLPRSMVIIGSGAIGVEMACIFEALGCQVTLLGRSSHILKNKVDSELAQALEEQMKKSGIRLELGVGVETVRESDTGLEVEYNDASGETRKAKGELVLEVTGRHPNVEGLGLEQTRIRYDPLGIKVNNCLETDEPGIYAIGDAVGHPMFAHWATAQALTLVKHLLDKGLNFPTPAINTAVIFSFPELGMAGLTEEQARVLEYKVETAVYDYAVDARAQVAEAIEGRLKFVYESSGRILGVHILADGAADLMGEAALIVRNGITIAEVASSIHPHPTLTESFGFLARKILMPGQPVRIPETPAKT